MPGNAGAVQPGERGARGRIDARALAAMLGRWPDTAGYRLLAARIGRLADAGDLPPDVLLPGERALAAALGVSRGTVTRAYRTLRAGGRARTRRGQGTRIASPVSISSAAGVAGGVPGGVADLATAVPDCAPQVAAALDRPSSLPHFPERPVVTDSDGHFPFGWPALRAAVAEMLTVWHGIPTNPAQVLITTGTQQALDLLIRAETLPGQTAVTEDPTYPGVLDALRCAGVRTAGVPPGDVERLASALSASNLSGGPTPALAYLVPTHQNPTGLVLPAEERHQIVDLAQRRPEIMFVDDMTLADLPLAAGARAAGPHAEGRYADGPQPPPLAALAPRRPNVVTVGSFSKLYWGGLRTGWLRAPEGIIARLGAVKAAADLGGPVYQQAIVAALVSGCHEEIIKWRSDWLQERYDALASALRSSLPAWDWTPPRGGLTIWARLPADLCGPRGRFPNADAFAAEALSRGVALTPGSALSASGSPSHHARLAFTRPPEELTAAVATLAEV